MLADTLDPEDLDLVAALQLAPRVSLQVLATTLGISTGTVSRRLTRLREHYGLRIVGQIPWWLDGATPHHVWVSTAPGHAREVATAVADLSEAQFVASTTGRADVYCILHPRRRDEAAELLTVTLPSIPGIATTHSELGLHRYVSGSTWRLHRLTADQEQALVQHRHGAPPDTPVPMDDDERAVATVLHRNGRASAAEIARELGRSASTAYRTTQSVLDRGLVQPRVEIEPAILGYPLEAVVSLSTSPASMRAIATALAGHESARYVTTVAGTSSVLHHGLFHHEDDLATFLSDDLGKHAGVTAFEVSTVLSVLTRYWSPRR
ncbi:DNA-binding Lrp family transcriptional regulator [Prauserella isguenensis]|uniref:DNA-binding Lrp family transcriptional regulator n=1 Tax=Prauserella isguenensis TaxID=1470180 RepID=A0A839S2U9_9PSEU|nr:Lrp/AsnC family transcriptional regulator [Prauserella isguenensis]MBB3051623.1 DNA-binding Lrp family transcriptional regulator [Prauserella isguenensis]